MASANSVSRLAQPAQLAAALGHGVSAALAARLQLIERLRPRLDQTLSARLGPLGELDAVQARILAMDTPALIRLASEAGAVWHAASIARLLDGPAVRALVAAIGMDLRQVALRGHTLAGPAQAANPEDIALAIPSDGAGCLAAWCEAQPRPVAARVDLRRPPALPGAGHRIHGPAIIASLALA